ncbi:hypothetical protein V1291_005292 [Nitrobacteraceae bacterium AZCC 1564]
MTNTQKFDWALLRRQLFQSLIFLAVMMASIEWPWTDNHYLASLVALLTMWGATALADLLANFWRSNRHGGPSD